MKRVCRILVTTFIAALFIGMSAQAKETVIHKGIYVNDIDLSDKTIEEARKEIEAYVDSFGDAQITLHIEEEGTIVSTLCGTWS